MEGLPPFYYQMNGMLSEHVFLFMENHMGVIFSLFYRLKNEQCFSLVTDIQPRPAHQV
jgi:hypothetical protein